MAIKSFDCKISEAFFNTGRSGKGGWGNCSKAAERKLDMLEAAVSLQDLKSPPGNHLEALKGNLVGCHSIKVNDQWRIVFKWTDEGPTKVRICDYHD